MLSGKRIFITGATGFIGSKLSGKLVEKNQVYALVRPESLVKTDDLRQQGIKIVTGDLLDVESYAAALDEMDYVFHLAALFKTEAPKLKLYRHNVFAVEKLLEVCRGKNIKKIIFFSTAYVAGRNEKEGITEDEPLPERFKNWYEWSKAEAEKRVLYFCKKYNLPVIIVRPVIVYGHGSFYGFYDAIRLIYKKKLWAAPGDGKNTIHLVHVDDVVNAAAYLAQSENTSGEVFHIADDYPVACDELIAMICSGLGIKPPRFKIPRAIVKIIGALPGSKYIFGGASKELLDYFLYSQSYSNGKLKSRGFVFKNPSAHQPLMRILENFRL